MTEKTSTSAPASAETQPQTQTSAPAKIMTFFENMGKTIAGKVKGVIEAERQEIAKEEAKIRREHDAAFGSVATLPPWEDLGEGVAPDVKAKVVAMVLALTRSRRSFLSAPPEDDTTYVFELEAALPSARAALSADSRLAAAREWLVPRKIHEKQFWRNWFWRVSAIKLSLGVTWPTPGVSLPAGSRIPKATAPTTEDDTEAWEAELRAALADYEATKGQSQSQSQKQQKKPENSSPPAVSPAPTQPQQSLPPPPTSTLPQTTTTTTTKPSTWEKEVEAELQQ